MTSDDAILRVILVIVALFLLVPLIGMVLMWPLMGAGHGGMWNGTGWWPLFSWLVLIALVVGVGYLLISAFRRGESTDAALEELRIAYARGDLSDEEFERRRERLRREE
ncbi:SHOCT domain-containing protein [Halovivax gelatinilyticus]|uniref:SHOCT domain-containing protein n=1 Tax=Halovivax gelatinilyticus TaxID=2961597 RepID=UPI0020CA5896|nr:SHOCT domain-containing protein [Halovivax gelatinilyticus]